jgi:hypothetical protein
MAAVLLTYLVVGQVRLCWMTMRTFTQFRRSGNARKVNWWWTGGELAVCGQVEGAGVWLVVEFARFSGEARCRSRFCA